METFTAVIKLRDNPVMIIEGVSNYSLGDNYIKITKDRTYQYFNPSCVEFIGTYDALKGSFPGIE